MANNYFYVFLQTHPLAKTSEAAFKGVVRPLILHPLGWVKRGYKFDIVDTLDVPRQPLIVITLTPQIVLDRLYPQFKTSRLSVCNMATREIFLNEERWLDEYDDNASGMVLSAYREYMVQHEMGHALGFGHVKPGEPNTPCPIMVQQTLGTHGCKPFPFPT